MLFPHKIAVLYGGSSTEREVSLRSGKAVLNGLQNAGLNAQGIDVGDDIVTQLIHGQFDFVFNVLHGDAGENGTICGLLEYLKLPYTGSGVLGSAIAMNQKVALPIWQQAGLPTPGLVALHERNVDLIKHLKLPIAIKPCNQGSSVGVTKLKTLEGFDVAFDFAAQHGPVIAQEWIEGKEYTVPIVGEHVLPPIWIEPEREFYDYEAKYNPQSGTQYHCPSDLTHDEIKQIQTFAKQAFDLIHCSGWGRVDLIRNKQGQFVLFEVNTVPGMTETSLVPKSAKSYGWDFETLLLKIIKASV